MPRLVMENLQHGELFLGSFFSFLIGPRSLFVPDLWGFSQDLPQNCITGLRPWKMTESLIPSCCLQGHAHPDTHDRDGRQRSSVSRPDRSLQREDWLEHLNSPQPCTQYICMPEMQNMPGSALTALSVSSTWVNWSLEERIWTFFGRVWSVPCYKF